MCINRSPFFGFRDGDILTDWIFQSREYWEFEEKNRQEGKMTFRCFFPWLSGHFWMSESSSFQSRFAYTAWLFETERDIGFVCDCKFAFRRMTLGRLFRDRMFKKNLDRYFWHADIWQITAGRLRGRNSIHCSFYFQPPKSLFSDWDPSLRSNEQRTKCWILLMSTLTMETDVFLQSWSYTKRDEWSATSHGFPARWQDTHLISNFRRGDKFSLSRDAKNQNCQSSRRLENAIGNMRKENSSKLFFAMEAWDLTFNGAENRVLSFC